MGEWWPLRHFSCSVLFKASCLQYSVQNRQCLAPALVRSQRNFSMSRRHILNAYVFAPLANTCFAWMNLLLLCLWTGGYGRSLHKMDGLVKQMGYKERKCKLNHSHFLWRSATSLVIAEDPRLGLVSRI
jgi:hypothetical protein